MIGMLAGSGLDVPMSAAGQQADAQAQTRTEASSAQTEPAPVFRSSVDLVSISAIVRDRKGRIVRDLGRDDFEVFDAGIRRPIVEFSPAEDGPVSVAILLDTSGSMRLSENLEAARLMVEHLLGEMRSGIDEVAFYSFDSGVRQTTGFTRNYEVVEQTLGRLHAFGSTAIFDSVGYVASQIEARPMRRRAVVLVTDGLDTSSEKTAADVSGIASASDVPVYVVTVGPDGVSTIAGPTEIVLPDPTSPEARLGNLAHWTGGALFNGRGPTAAGATARALLAELRHQYLLGFESAGPGWRPVDVRLRRSEVTVRTRSAYQSSRPIS
jgi:Ca-activated chloride channel family protein